MSQLATLTHVGRAAIAKAIKERRLHLAWGVGDPSWEVENLPSLVESTALYAEIGRRSISTVGFVTPDKEGGIVIPVGTHTDGSIEEARYSQVETPTPYLYVRVNYDFGDAANAVIREIGVFMDTVIQEDLPAGLQYFLPEQIEDKGLLLAVQILEPPLNRGANIRQSIEFVMPI